MPSHKRKEYEQPTQLVKINANSTVIYQERKTFSGRHHYSFSDTNEETTSILPSAGKKRNNQTNGFLSDRAGNRLRTYIKYLLWTSGCYKVQGKKIFLRLNGRISFLTLTLCSDQMHDDNFVKLKMLNQFIIELSKKFIGIRYIWRAEKQENGNIHFHFLINKYVPWSYARYVWVRIQKKEGYLQKYTQKFLNITFDEYLKTIKKPLINKMADYRRAWNKGNECGWTNPPCSWIEGLKDSKKALYYITKYISKKNNNLNLQDKKDVEKLKIKGHLWFCSQELMSLNGSTEHLDYEVQKDLMLIQRLRPNAFFHDTFVTVIKLSVEDLFNLGCYHLYNCFISSFSILNKNDLFTP